MIVLDDRPFIEAIHAEQLRQHGGGAGLRDEGLLESALNRPLQKPHYADADVFELAAAYLFGLVKNHPFIDGNKRTAFLAADVFLALNGWSLEATQEEIIVFVLGVAASEIDEAGAVQFFRDYAVAVDSGTEPL
ncbi:MAG TPA: type II toxin-antitoxin system death-on-curing family toxin [Hyphomicrobiales bacterium]|nr:type II toxin-antitoxin system death-on-curing family toxin [Hyphomicrobiales bacterium]